MTANIQSVSRFLAGVRAEGRIEQKVKEDILTADIQDAISHQFATEQVRKKCKELRIITDTLRTALTLLDDTLQEHKQLKKEFDMTHNVLHSLAPELEIEMEKLIQETFIIGHPNETYYNSIKRREQQ